MAGPKGQLAVVGKDGLMYLVSEAEAQDVVQSGYRPATEQEFAARTAAKQREEQYGTTGQQALALAEKAGETATFGLLPDLDGAAERKAEVERQSPFLAMGAEAAGAAGAAAAAASGAGAIAGAVGAGAGVAAGAGVLAEGLAGGVAGERERTRGTDEAFSGANALMFGVGGELLGRGLGAALRGGSRGLTNILGRVETEALEDAARSGAQGGAKGRAVALEQAPERFSAEVQKTVTKHVDTLKLDDLRNPVAKANVDEMVPVTAPVHEAWAADTLERAQRLVDEMVPENQVELRQDPARGAPEATSMKDAADRVIREIKDDLGGAGVDQAKLDRINADARELGKRRRKTLEQRPGAGKAPKDYTHEQLAERRQNLEQQAAITRRTPFGASLYPDVPRTAGVGWVDGEFALPGNVRTAVQNLQKGLSEGRSSGSMFKKAAQVYADLADVAHPAAPQLRALIAEGLTDRSLFGRAAEAFETLSRTGEALTREGIESLSTGSLDAVDAALAARRAFGVDPPKNADKAIAGLRQSVRDLADAEVATATRSAATEPAAEVATAAPQASGMPELASELLKSKATGMIQGGIAAAATALTGSPMLGAGAAFAFGRLGKAWSAATTARVADSARRFAGVAARPAEVAGVGVGAAGLSRFTGDYSSPREAYEARAESLRAAAADPTLLWNTVAKATGDLGTEAPGFYRNLAGTTTSALTFLTQNLPVQSAASMLYPRGLPPTDSQVRQFALLWNAVTAPETVLEALGEGTATPAQVRALEAVHPDLYTGLRDEVIRQVSSAPQQVSQQTKVWLDLVFNTDGLAGPSYTIAGGKMLRPPSQPAQQTAGPTLTPTQAALAVPSQPVGLAAAQSGPTSR